MTHRIREAMAPSDNADQLGGERKTVEVDETFMANSRQTRQDKPLHAKSDVEVMTLVERGGPIRSVFLDERGVRGALVEHLHEDSRLVYGRLEQLQVQVMKHESVDQSKCEWARGDVHTNTLEGFFSRYLAEFDFRYNNRAKLGMNEPQRAENALKAIGGKRVTCRCPDEA